MKLSNPRNSPTRRARLRRALVLASLIGSAALTSAAGGISGCSTSDGTASARIITNRSQLIGGPRALGEVGDYLLENEQIRIIIQKPGFSRGFGVYGGSLIDADLRRPDEQGSSGEAVGFDQFGELFPAFFVQAAEVDEVTIINDGTDGKAAVVEAAGEAGDFLELLAVINRVVTGSNVDFQNGNSPPRLRYSTRYELSPGKKYITNKFSVKNITTSPVTFPGPDSDIFELLGLPTEGFTVPVGDVALFGATSSLWIPGIGYDLRFGLEAAYQRTIDWPAFPGLYTDFIASSGNGTSYGLIVEESDNNYVFNKQDTYFDGRTAITKSSILVPFAASSFIGVFYQDAPPELAPGESFTVTKHFIIGDGDVGSVLDTIYEIRGTETGRLGGQVIDEVTGAESEDTSAIVYQRFDDGYRRPYSQYDVLDGGFFGGTLAPGKYSVKILGEGRPATDYVDFSIAAGETTPLLIGSTPPGRIVVTVVDENGEPLPAKATAVGRYAEKFSNQLTNCFLFDLQAGEEFRTSDLVPDGPDGKTRYFIEKTGFTEDGQVVLPVRPGSYEVVSSRGPEYDAKRTTITIGGDETVNVNHTLTRVVDTSGWVAIDSHIHSRNSIDSGMGLDERVLQLAAEGVEVAVSTDHNYVTDFAPFVARNNLDRWVRPIVGVEMTTLESGHFNGYPLDYQVGPITHGAFEWARRPPDAIWDDMRALGAISPEETIIQVNHPRDEILGYYSQYNRSSNTHDKLPAGALDSFISPTGPAFVDQTGKTTFSFNYDAVELANGKLYWEMHHYRVPEQLPPGELPATIPPTGSILRDEEGEVAYPGVIDDWFNLLNQGYRYVGVGTGDSHSSEDEPGQFRTMVYVGDDDRPEAISEQRLVDGLQSRRAVVTNGPLLDFYVNSASSGAMGKTIVDNDGALDVTIKLTAAPWMSIGRINVYQNGVIAAALDVDQNRNLANDPLSETLQIPQATDVNGSPIDSWVVVEAIGYRSMFPVIRTLEIPPVVLTDAVASLAGPLGLGGDSFGDLRPLETFPVTPFAITNPVWIKRGDGDWQAPGVVPPETQDLPENDPKFMAGVYAPRSVGVCEPIGVQPNKLKLESTPTQLPVPFRGNRSLFYPPNDSMTDIRKVLGRYGHLQGHVD